MKCRHCRCDLKLPLVDLGSMPPSNAYLSTPEQFSKEVKYPLKVWVCENCWLVQTQDFAQAEELFTADYAYFSSTSSSWLEHSRRYVEDSIQALGLNSQSFVVEIASNDGYLLKNYLRHSIPCLGIEPTEATANAARNKGLEVVSEFFGVDLSYRLRQKYPLANLIIANNVLAHVPDINDFVLGIKHLLAESGAVSLEFPHLLNLMRDCLFDTIYHEHYSYLSLGVVQTILNKVGLRVFNVEQLATHGGSLRVWCCHDKAVFATNDSVGQILRMEAGAGLEDSSTYRNFQYRVNAIANEFRCYLQKCKQEGKTVVAYGAAAKGNTLLNYAGIDSDLISVVFDAAKSKQGKFLPGSHIPILPPVLLLEHKPDVIVILPWNLADEVKSIIHHQKIKAVTFVVAVPNLIISE